MHVPSLRVSSRPCGAQPVTSGSPGWSPTSARGSRRWPSPAELRAAVEDLRAHGKPAVCWSETFGELSARQRRLPPRHRVRRDLAAAQRRRRAGRPHRGGGLPPRRPRQARRGDAARPAPRVQDRGRHLPALLDDRRQPRDADPARGVVHRHGGRATSRRDAGCPRRRSARSSRPPPSRRRTRRRPGPGGPARLPRRGVRRAPQPARRGGAEVRRALRQGWPGAGAGAVSRAAAGRSSPLVHAGGPIHLGRSGSSPGRDGRSAPTASRAALRAAAADDARSRRSSCGSTAPAAPTSPPTPSVGR